MAEVYLLVEIDYAHFCFQIIHQTNVVANLKSNSRTVVPKDKKEIEKAFAKFLQEMKNDKEWQQWHTQENNSK